MSLSADQSKGAPQCAKRDSLPARFAKQNLASIGATPLFERISPLSLRTSLQFGITSLKKINYDRVALEERRRSCEEDNVDVLVWTNDRVIKWVTSIGLKVS